MRVDALHRRLMTDVKQLHDAIARIFPVELPAAYENRAVNLQAFLNRLNTRTAAFGIFNRIKHDAEQEKGTVVNSAWWYDKSVLPVFGSSADVHILWHVHPDAHRVTWGKAGWKRRRFYYWQFIMHELIHRYQDVLRKKYHGPKANALQYAATSRAHQEREVQVYLGDYDEVETYAFMTALEIFSWWPFMTVNEACVCAHQYTGRHVTPTFNYYTVCFDKHAPAVKTFKRKIRAWLSLMKEHHATYEMLRLPQLI